MSRVDYEQSALFEHRFWLQILGDHARFISNHAATLIPQRWLRTTMITHLLGMPILTDVTNFSEESGYYIPTVTSIIVYNIQKYCG